MMRVTAIVLSAVILLAALGGAGKAATSNKAAVGKWASNGEAAIKVNKVEEKKTWEEIGKLIRWGSEQDKEFKHIRDALGSGNFKAVVIHVEMRNDSDKKMNIGYDCGHDGKLWLRGEEGSERSSWDVSQVHGINTKDGKRAGSKLVFHLEGGLPKKAEMAKGASIKGKVLWIVESWFVPVKLFTRPKSTNSLGKTELVITLK